MRAHLGGAALLLIVATGLAQAQGPAQASAADATGVASPPLAWAVSQALDQALPRRQPVLVEFRAPWCYSCYYMARHVHTGAEWEALKRRAQVVELDADSPEGAAQMQAWGLKPLPAYVVLDAEGHERGRVLGELSRAAFYARMDVLLAAGFDPEALRVRALAGGAAGLTATRAALTGFRARQDAAAGLRWFYDLPGPVRATYERDAAVRDTLARSRFDQAVARGDAEGCRRTAAAALAVAACDLPYEIRAYERCLGPDAAAEDALLQAQRAPLERLVTQRVWAGPDRCADERSVVLGLSALLERAGDTPARERLLTRAIDDVQTRLADDLGRDRSAADNLRVYLEKAERWDDLDRLMPRLIATWPSDYVYAFRFGRSLVDRDRPSEALPYLTRAAQHAYGENRLLVAEQRVKALKRLGRLDEARAVLAEALRANGPWFPERVAALKAQL